MEIKNRSGPNIDPCGTPYGTDRESDNVLQNTGFVLSVC